jgi:hypothetical protein
MTLQQLQALFQAIGARLFPTFSPLIEAIAITLLILLLVEQELIHAYGGPRYAKRTRAFDLAIVLLLIAFGLIVAMHLAPLLIQTK